MDKRAKIPPGTNSPPEDEERAGSGAAIRDDSHRVAEPSDAGTTGKKARPAGNGQNELKDELTQQIDLPQRGAP
ncbi:hypothetical protein CO674_25175 [Rhizobium hidalgonense]|uniref:Uncharacterized protein n=1 Tax=Rhizobium hidalgonense TaxID=1538159 RepID=A0ABX4JNG3_9HYPH|nr:hypothetical protein CO674_25175 [Rhizobium hidalgonense]